MVHGVKSLPTVYLFQLLKEYWDREISFSSPVALGELLISVVRNKRALGIARHPKKSPSQDFSIFHRVQLQGNIASAQGRHTREAISSLFLIQAILEEIF